MDSALDSSIALFLGVVSRTVYEAELDMKERIIAALSDGDAARSATSGILPRKYADVDIFKNGVYAPPPASASEQRFQNGDKSARTGEDCQACDAAPTPEAILAAGGPKRKRPTKKKEVAIPADAAKLSTAQAVATKLPKKRTKKTVVASPPAVATLENVDLDIDSAQDVTTT
jgi:hypothetical protein